VNLRQGAVKQARQEARLSLAQVGKGQVTAPAIYLIETGRTRPSLPTLEHIARRTGKPIEFFLADPGGVTDETQSGLIDLEAKVAALRFEEAIAVGQRLMDLATSAHRLGRIRFLLAQAYLNLAKPDQAAVLLREAHAHFEATGDELMLAECLGSEASLAYLTQKPGAKELIERALDLCGRFRPVPHTTLARLLSIQGSVLLANKEWDPAIEIYEKAIEAAGSLYDLRRLALMYGGLALAYHETGQTEAAARYAMRSIAFFEVLNDRISLSRAENNLGLIYLAKQDHAAAREHLDRSLELSQETQMEVGRSNVLMSLCELSLEEGNVQTARDLAQEALELAERLDESANIAEAHVWLGQVADRDGDAAAADGEFQQAIQGLTRIGVEERLRRCHGIYAEVLERRGDLEQAYVHMKQAFAGSRPGLLRRDLEGSADSASLA
jgi:tetratricopeptide (TPR) repeat protein